MSFAHVLLAPFALLLPVAGLVDASRDPAADPAGAGPDGDGGDLVAYDPPLAEDMPWSLRILVTGIRPDTAEQVRIEQRMTIRITPRPTPVRPDLLLDLPGREIGPRLSERKMGKCLSVSGIAGVQTDGGNRLILFLRDQRIVRAELERSCRAKDFYSGFYLARSGDGQLCVDRDTLLSRSGANCKLTRLRQLIESDR